MIPVCSDDANPEEPPAGKEDSEETKVNEEVRITGKQIEEILVLEPKDATQTMQHSFLDVVNVSQYQLATGKILVRARNLADAIKPINVETMKPKLNYF